MGELFYIMRTIKLIILCSLATYIFVACGNSATNSDNKNNYNNYREAVDANDFSAAHKMLGDLYEEYTAVYAKREFNIRKDSSFVVQEKYYKAFDYVYGKEIQFLLSNFEGKDVADKITFLLHEIPRDGRKFPAGLCDYSVACMGTWGAEGKPLKAYVIWVEHYNNLCSKILSLAINRKNEEVAKQVLMCFEDNVEVTEGESNGIMIDGVSVDGNHGYIKYTTKDKDEANEKYKKAVELGIF